jgi:prepilin-type N-terminal cleavage/methylation domain-containing protein
MTARSVTRGEAGFTLIEMMIAMVLVAGLMIVISTVLTKTFGESGRAQQERKAAQDMRSTMGQFGNDLRVARSPDRDPRYVGNGNDLGGALLASKPLQVQLPGAAAPTTLDVRDVVEATSTSFAFRADVLPNAGVECVRYAVDTQTRQLVRTVLSYNPVAHACILAPELQRQVLVQAVQ